MTLVPGTAEWARVVSASKVAGILGLSPWDSPRAVWHLMRGDLPPAPESRPMRRGNMLENAVLDWWLADNPEWEEVERQPSYTIDPEWCVATPDMLVRHRETGEHMLIDAKTTSTDDDWIDGEPPAYYVASSMWQLAMAPDVERVCLAALFGRPFDMRSYYVARDDDLIDGLVSRCRAFWESLTDDNAGPALTDMPCEYDVVRRVHVDIDKGETATIPDDLAAEFATAYHAEKALPSIKARVLEAMGRAQYGVDSGGVKIARRQPSGDSVALYCTAPKPFTTPEGIAS
jgi:predicted phage-related endonuclease